MTYSPTRPENSWAETDTRPGARRGPARMGRAGRFFRGRPDDPAWIRPGLLGLLAATAVLYIWGLGASGWANSFYAAAVQAGTKSWKAFLFGSFDPSNFITVDKSPGALWVMELSGRVFGFSSWSMLVPEAIEGVITVGLVYLAVRRWFTPGAGLLAGAVTALTPAAVLMFRFNNPDALMVMLLALAAYATVRAVDDGRARWAVLAGTAVGFAFLAKMLEAFLIVPALALVILVAGYGPLRSRLRQLLYGGAALAVSAGWWLLLVTLTPAADRPYVGGSQDNSIWNLMFGYNGFGRLTGNETGSVGGGGGTGGRWGSTGLTRLFGSEMGTQASWLLPAALILLVAGLVVTRRAARTNRTRAGLLLWGGWLVVAGLSFSLGKGIIHPYYTVALAPALGGLVGAGGSLMWANRDRFVARAVLSGSIAVTAIWAVVLLDRTPHWLPWLRPVVLVAGLIGAGGVLLWNQLPGQPKSLRSLAGGLALFGGLAAPLAYTLDTVNTPHSGAIPSAGPTGASVGAGPGGFGRPGGARGLSNRAFGQGFAQIPGGGSAGGSTAPTGGPPNGAFPWGFRQGTPTGGSFGGRTGGGFGGTGGGGLLNASRPSAAMVTLLEHDASKYKWVAAAVGANDAAGYQLATGDAVMAIGGFNGTDPYPSLAQFEKLVQEGQVHYFIAGGGGFGGPGGGGTSSGATAITSWVENNYSSTSVGGVTVYDLTTTATGGSR
jgi:4-amino-4-deoxy-L-arabinose transferase-like glycosyltransferase